ncbi:hypothetical protein L2E82_05710 [Cichorium intybus]|uniref:Uncharacterized protein n=1 Tax=Cichorium intybus TaxID=13427 RepID=A0ACB9HA70_CICIN|nr:hypothetical protein L2E82_05710 [Cichorium intybus]
MPSERAVRILYSIAMFSSNTRVLKEIVQLGMGKRRRNIEFLHWNIALAISRKPSLLSPRPSEVLQRELPRPPGSVVDFSAVGLIRKSLVRGDEDKSSFVPPTLIEHVDEMIRRVILVLLDHHD